MQDKRYNDNYFSFYNNALLNQSILDVFVLQDIFDYEEAEKLKRKFKTNREVENFLIKNKIIDPDTVNKAYSIILKLPYIELKSFQVPNFLKDIITKKIANQLGIIPFSFEDGVIRIALTRPADLLVSYENGIKQLFEEKNLEVELFITGFSDFSAVIKQYDVKKKEDESDEFSNLPVVYLQNQSIPSSFLKKLPIDFIEKYRMVVFGQNRKGLFLIASEDPKAPVTAKILTFLKEKNGIKYELFATSKDDIEYAISLLYGRRPKVNILKQKQEQAKQEEIKKEDVQKKVDKNIKSASFSEMLESFFAQKEPQLTVDEIPRSDILDENESVTPEVKPVAATKPAVLSKKDKPVKVESSSVVEAEKTSEKTEPPISDQKQKDSSLGQVSKAEEKPTEFIEPEGAVQDTKSKLESNDIGSLISEDIKTIDQLEGITREGYIPKIVAAVINYALNQRSSDIHVEPDLKYLRIRCRIDGVLKDVLKIGLKFHPPFVSRIKILSKLKIDETRIPQDGRFDVRFNSREVDVRVSTLPTVHGEKVVMRILDKSQSILSLEDLGMMGSAIDETIKAIAKPYGVLLSTGPTGSGKSTTLYAVLNRISLPGVNVVTLEDPVEYEIPGINQCQIKPDIGFTFASGLRSILRQDPNIIMVGEIRDAETASMATHAALTGHLVLSTLHTNDTAGALPRLINMGIEPFLITSSVNLIIAQRLVRRICPKCREEMKVPQKLMDQVTEEIKKIPEINVKDRARLPKELKLYYGKGCSECTHGYKGRIGIFEVMEITPEIEELAITKSSANEIKNAAIKNGMITMKQDGILKAFTGLTTIDEVFQAVIISQSSMGSAV